MVGPASSRLAEYVSQPPLPPRPETVRHPVYRERDCTPGAPDALRANPARWREIRALTATLAADDVAHAGFKVP